eukprot:CAMPEP_0202892056 /NCGR_PEP_ID=MMETSP1392-20130828/1902_1 /ASSEMBLY_ACC=CAM_ASM_000868 /TAXON_ID=225041 /ORGANISM="Chlamydomonas chlamydogama, Strain SAG 11-48b" /LENGTH=719 /DNA_ID=CAMNT_0049575931 /DNA_START=74 /DNA_END=2233 /DNA_ORIENTATION=-
MADTVQYLLEEQIPELEDFERRGYFTKAELKAIMRKRQDFEYQLKRRAALKQDFYRYIEYEMKLEELRKLRKKTLSITGKKSLADVAIIRRIHFIYERAARKFKSDLNLWMRWIEYCKTSRSHKQLSKVVTKALQRHITVSALWIEAAAWEFERGSNVASARALMQQGLRVCKGDAAMWAEYVRMELLYVAKLRARREVLGLDVPDAPVSATPAAPSSEDGEEGQQGPDPELAVRAVLTGAVAKVAVRNAMSTLRDSLELRQRLLAVIGEFDFPGIEELVELVYSSLESHFSAIEEAWDMRAQRHAAAAPTTPEFTEEDAAAPSTSGRDGDGGRTGRRAFDPASHKRVMGVYEQALGAVPTQRMYTLVVGYLARSLEELLAASAAAGSSSDSLPATAAATEEGQRPSKRRKQSAAAAGAAGTSADAATVAVAAAAGLLEAASELGAELLSTLARAHEAGVSGIELYITWVDWACRLGQYKMAVSAADSACRRHASSAEAWACCLRLQMQLRSGRRKQQGAKEEVGAVGSEVVIGTLREALAAVPPERSTELWLLALEEVAGPSDLSKLADLLSSTMAAASKGPPSGGMGAVAARFVERISQEHGLEAARAFYRRLLPLPPAGGDFFRAAIALEQADRRHQQQQSGARTSPHDAAIKRLHEAAVDAYGSVDPEVWLDYAKYEMSQLRGAAPIYWRATKALADPDAFIEQYRQAMGSTPMS